MTPEALQDLIRRPMLTRRSMTVQPWRWSPYTGVPWASSQQH